MRAAVVLLVIAGMGYRRVEWLLGVLFHGAVSKSSFPGRTSGYPASPPTDPDVSD
jgi:hypothetical protein